MIEFNDWLLEVMPSVGMAVWLGLTAYVAYIHYLWRKAIKNMPDEEDKT